MKRFSFKLQPVLKYRQYLEHLAQLEVAESAMELKRSQDKIEDLRRFYTQTMNTLDAEASKGISASEFKSYKDYLDSVENAIELETLESQKLKKLLVEKQKKLTQKSIQRKVIERLKEKRKNEYMADFRKDEQTSMDEMASLKKAREINNASR